MSGGRPKLLWVLLVVIFAGIVAMQNITGPQYEKIRKAGMSSVDSKDTQELMVQLPGQFLIASMAGFKEVIAGVLWVRADDFFHTGKYEAIIPIVRLVTWLDPHNIEVYSTGAWHLDYNFLDKNVMSDKRYIPSSVALLQEGIANNPNTWDLYFDLAWTHYNKKLNDYQGGLKYMLLAVQHDGRDPNTGKVIPRPAFVDRMVAHQYEKVGEFDKAIEQWKYARARAERLIKDRSDNTADYIALVICDRNLALLYLRLAWRYGNMDYYRKGVEIMQRMAAQKGTPPDILAAAKATSADYAKRMAAHDPPRDVRKPIDMGFSVKFEKLKPKVFRISGTFNLLKMSEYAGLASECMTHSYEDYLKAPPDRKQDWVNGGRVRWMLTDLDYKMVIPKTFTWKIDKSKMVVFERECNSIPVLSGKFKSQPIDLSGDDSFYPFKARKYRLVVWASPQYPGADETLQDRVGWKGEAYADGKYLDTKMQPGYRCFRWETVLDRNDLL